MIKMIIKRSPTLTHVSRTHIVAIGSLFDQLNLDPKSKSSTSTSKNQLLTKGNFTRDEWNHLLYVFNISHFSSVVCSETMAKRSQHDSGKERVTAKSRPMMSLIARVPSHESSSTSVSPGKRCYGNQDPWKSVVRMKASDYYHHEQLWKVSPQQATQSGMMTMLGLLKSGKLMLRCTSDRDDPMKLLGERHEKFDLVSLTRKPIMMEPRNPL